MLTPFGKALRKLRIDHGVMLKDVAERIGVSSSYLSAVETGKKPIPAGFVDRIAASIPLNRLEVEDLRRSAVISGTEFRISLPKDASMEAREAAALLARTFEDGDNDIILKVRELIERRRA